MIARLFMVRLQLVALSWYVTKGTFEWWLPYYGNFLGCYPATEFEMIRDQGFNKLRNSASSMAAVTLIWLLKRSKDLQPSTGLPFTKRRFPKMRIRAKIILKRPKFLLPGSRLGTRLCCPACDVCSLAQMKAIFRYIMTRCLNSWKETTFTL